MEDGLEIKPGETVMLKPSSFHVMLMNLKHSLQKGKMVKATDTNQDTPVAEGSTP